MIHQAPVSADWSMTDQEFDQLRRTIYAYSGIVIGPEKRSMIRARLQRRLKALQLTSLASYLRLVGGRAGNAERELFISSLTTNVTSFFRERHHFKLMTETIIPARKPGGDRFQVWSAGCSSGQEPYSIAISILEKWPEMAGQTRILASDIDAGILSRARAACYKPAELSGLSPELASRYLHPAPGGGRAEDREFCRNVTRMVEFRQINLNSGWNLPPQFDVIFCRNVAIYFDPDTQKSLWRRFHGVLRPGGWLLIGHSERVPAELHNLLQPGGITAYRKI